MYSTQGSGLKIPPKVKPNTESQVIDKDLEAHAYLVAGQVEVIVKVGKGACATAQEQVVSCVMCDVL